MAEQDFAMNAQFHPTGDTSQWQQPQWMAFMERAQTARLAAAPVAAPQSQAVAAQPMASFLAQLQTHHVSLDAQLVTAHNERLVATHEGMMGMYSCQYISGRPPYQEQAMLLSGLKGIAPATSAQFDAWLKNGAYCKFVHYLDMYNETHLPETNLTNALTATTAANAAGQVASLLNGYKKLVLTANGVGAEVTPEGSHLDLFTIGLALSNMVQAYSDAAIQLARDFGVELGKGALAVPAVLAALRAQEQRAVHNTVWQKQLLKWVGYMKVAKGADHSMAVKIVCIQYGAIRRHYADQATTGTPFLCGFGDWPQALQLMQRIEAEVAAAALGTSQPNPRFGGSSFVTGAAVGGPQRGGATGGTQRGGGAPQRGGGQQQAAAAAAVVYTERTRYKSMNQLDEGKQYDLKGLMLACCPSLAVNPETGSPHGACTATGASVANPCDPINNDCKYWHVCYVCLKKGEPLEQCFAHKVADCPQHSKRGGDGKSQRHKRR